MSEETKETVQPEIVLEMGDAPTPTTPELTLETSGKTVEIATPQKIESLEERVNLSPAEQKQVDEFAEKIDIHDTTIIMQFGNSAQKKMVNFSENALNSVRSKDLGEVGSMLTGLVTELKSFSVEETQNSGFFGNLFKKSSNKITSMQVKYNSAEQNVNAIVSALEEHQITLLKDIAMLDEMYDQNVLYFKELSMYILAGKKKLKQVRETEIPELREKAEQSKLPEDAQAVNDLVNLCDRFEKKIYDLELTRTISIQMAPQIRLIQNNDTLMSEKIQSTLVNTIPLWKSQMVLSMGVTHAQQAAEAQRQVTDMTNELLRKNSETLKTASVATARESERGVVEIETLQATNQNLIETLDEVMRIQNEGREKRAAAEIELGRIEGQLKDKLLELKG